MTSFDPQRLRVIRRGKGVSAVELARRIGISAVQIHRLEKGLRRLTVDALLQYCDALDVPPDHLLKIRTRVPITGVINSDFEVEALPRSTTNETLAPPLINDMSAVSGLRWAASRRFKPMLEHVVFYQSVSAGVPEHAWDKRCLLTRDDGSQCLGWPTRDQGSVHVDMGDGLVEFNIKLTAASPVIAVIPPFVLEDLHAQNVDSESDSL